MEQARKTMKEFYVKVNSDKCIGCRLCLRVCPSGAMKMNLRKAEIDQEKCIGCLECMKICPRDAIEKIIIGKESVKEIFNSLEELKRKVNELNRRVDILRRQRLFIHLHR